jgi:hypothetical protein
MTSEAGDAGHDRSDVSASDQTTEASTEQQPVLPALLSAQPSFSYLQAMAGFMGVVETPKAADPALQAELALDFLNTMWQVCEVSSSPIAVTIPVHAVFCFQDMFLCYRNKSMALMKKLEDVAWLLTNRQHTS